MTAALGWIGTALVLASYAQPSMVRLRRISLLASAILIVFNVLIEVWSNVALEIALVAINIGRMRHAARSAGGRRGRDHAAATWSQPQAATRRDS